MLAIVILLGLAVGSFLNVAIFRTHEEETVLRGRSKCRSCETPLGFVDLVPIVSFLVLRGRCRRCKTAISWQYPLVELATAMLFLLFYLQAAPIASLEAAYALLGDWILLSFLVVIFVYDLKHMAILDRFTVPAMVLTALFNLWTHSVDASSMLWGVIVIAGFFSVQFALSRGEWIGGGDIRMGALMGFALGLEQGVVAVFLAYVLGAVVGIVLYAAKKAQRKTPLPFGTFLTLSTAVMLFVGDAPLRGYLQLFS
ncbi:prepilin peptidase [Candidatus Parcubacteria bacterium]|nr:prepilin peptidase [Candidatus Parcubacteria bacterium]